MESERSTTTTPVDPSGSKPRSRVSSPRAEAAAATSSPRATATSATRSTRARRAAPRSAPTSWLSTTPALILDLRHTPVPLLHVGLSGLELQLEDRANTRREIGRLFDLGRTLGPRQHARPAGEVLVPPLLQRLGDELEGSPALFRSVFARGVLEQRERLLERREHGERLRFRLRRESGGPARPRDIHERGTSAD